MDRNDVEIDGVSYDVWSLSARRAWIEMSMIQYAYRLSLGRSPQGERG